MPGHPRASPGFNAIRPTGVHTYASSGFIPHGTRLTTCEHLTTSIKDIENAAGNIPIPTRDIDMEGTHDS
jgi:hypothetical protein